MSYDPEILFTVVEELRQRRRRRELDGAALRDRLYAEYPRLRELDGEISSICSQAVQPTLSDGTDPEQAMKDAHPQLSRLRAERGKLLGGIGISEGELYPLPLCSACGDSGYIFGRPCACLREHYIREQNALLSRALDFENKNFGKFETRFYPEEEQEGIPLSPRAIASRAYDTCLGFARNFRRLSGTVSLLISGQPGLGKTFLAACIACEVSSQGFWALYTTASDMLALCEEERFGRGEDRGRSGRFTACDLLILDDLGTEFTTSFTQSALFDLIDTRLREKKSTVVTTNLSPEERAERYTRQIASRLDGEYELLPLYGTDIRLQK